jgi:hypothetical protein
MPNISEIVNVSITREERGVSAQGFGTPLILGIHTKFAEVIKSYNGIDAVADDFITSDPEYIAANAMFSQAQVPETVKIGKLVANVKQKMKVTPTSSADGDYSVVIDAVTYTYTASSDTIATIIDGLIAAITAGKLNLLLTDNATDFDIEAEVAGNGFSVTAGTANLTVAETTANSNPATQLATIRQTDDDFYFVTLTSNAKNDIKNMAAYIESKSKLFGAMTNDINVTKSPQPHIQVITWDADFVTGNTIDLHVNGEAITQVTFATDHATTIAAVATNIQALTSVATAVADAVPRTITITGATNGIDIPVTQIVVAGGASQANSTVSDTQYGLDIGQYLEDQNYDRTLWPYSSDSTKETEMSWIGLQASKTVGSTTWFGKTLKGVSVESLTDSVRAIIHGKNGNLYVKRGTADKMEHGTVASGEWIDTMRGTDWIHKNIEAAVFNAITTVEKIPYTQQGADAMGGVVLGVLFDAVDRGILAADPAPRVVIPKVADIGSADKGNRVLPDLKFYGTYAGAIHKTTINGFLAI